MVGDNGAQTRDLGEQGRHGETVLPAVLSLLESAALGWHEVGLLAVCVGPGSFTGIRVGVSCVLGLSEARGLPAGGVSSLDILARACYDATSPQIGVYMVSVVDVRRGEVVWGGFRVGPVGPVRTEEDRRVPVAQPGPAPPPGTLVVGDAPGSLWEEAVGLLRWIPSGPERARATAALGQEAWEAGTFPPPRPCYAREADARPRRS